MPIQAAEQRALYAPSEDPNAPPKKRPRGRPLGSKTKVSRPCQHIRLEASSRCEMIALLPEPFRCMYEGGSLLWGATAACMRAVSNAGSGARLTCHAPDLARA